MLSILKYGYKVTKPRVQTVNTKSLEAYRKQMHEARVRVHKQAVAYLNRIEDQFLEKHKKEMAERHFNNECAFRAKISRNSYILHQSLEKEKSRHQEHLERVEKYIREQEIKRLNRDRIRKILEYESANFWLQGDEIAEKVISDKVLPEYIGSTEYYHKLHSEALAYDELDFDLLHKLSSNEESVEYKNKMLIPLYKQVLAIMQEVKYTDEQKAQKLFQKSLIKLKNKYSKDQAKLKDEIQSLNEKHRKNINEIREKQNTPQKKLEYFKQKLKELIILLKKWKQYTDILGMTSAEVLTIIEENKNESAISARKKELQKDIEKRREKTFIDAVEEDTEDQQVVSLEKIIQRKKPETNENVYTDQQFQAELEKLLKRQQNILDQISGQVEKKERQLQQEGQNLANVTEDVESSLALEELKIDEEFLQPTETTTSIEVLKQQYRSDKETQSLLNIAGELTIEYPKLFKKIWDTQI